KFSGPRGSGAGSLAVDDQDPPVAAVHSIFEAPAGEVELGIAGAHLSPQRALRRDALEGIGDADENFVSAREQVCRRLLYGLREMNRKRLARLTCHVATTCRAAVRATHGECVCLVSNGTGSPEVGEGDGASER